MVQTASFLPALDSIDQSGVGSVSCISGWSAQLDRDRITELLAGRVAFGDTFRVDDGAVMTRSERSRIYLDHAASAARMRRYRVA
jgi:hypothetical protein